MLNGWLRSTTSILECGTRLDTGVATASVAILCPSYKGRLRVGVTFPQASGALEYCLDDVLVAGTPAKSSRQHRLHFFERWVRVLSQERVNGHQDPGSAETALESVELVESLLDR